MSADDRLKLKRWARSEAQPGASAATTHALLAVVDVLEDILERMEEQA